MASAHTCEVVHGDFIAWAAGICVLTIIGIAIRLENLASRVKDVQQRVIDTKTMHEHADDYGFGTKETNEMLQGLLTSTRTSAKESDKVYRALTAMIHYITYDIKQRTGHSPPPPPIDPGD
jgi:hypothetical protein